MYEAAIKDWLAKSQHKADETHCEVIVVTFRGGVYRIPRKDFLIWQILLGWLHEWEHRARMERTKC